MKDSLHNSRKHRNATKKQATGFTVMLIPDSSDSAHTREISFDRIVRVIAGTIAAFIIVVGLLVSMVVNNRDLKRSAAESKDTIKALKIENSELSEKIDELSGQIKESEALFSKIEQEMDRRAKEEEEAVRLSAIPSTAPVKGSAVLVQDKSLIEAGLDEFTLVFSTLPGAFVVATADGTVESVAMDPVFGRRITVDHGNGYVTIFRTDAQIQVESGDTVHMNDVLAVAMSEEGKAAYEVELDGVYIDPYSVIED